jgi:hypothetical protein
MDSEKFSKSLENHQGPPDASPTVHQLTRETSLICEELLKMRSELASQSCLLLENASKDVKKEREIIKLVQNLQSEIFDLNLQIDSALIRMQDKEVENLFLKQNINQAKFLNEKKSSCECHIM